MRGAYQKISQVFHEREEVCDLRAAAFVLAIEKISRSYTTMGM